MEGDTIKKRIHETCLKLVHEKINTLHDVISEVQAAINSESKSSAGDKHETGRSMAQLETERLSTQLSEILKMKQILDSIDPIETKNKKPLGRLIITNRGNFYLSIGLGKILIENEEYYSISPQSPLGKLLATKKKNEKFTFNKLQYEMLYIY